LRVSTSELLREVSAMARLTAANRAWNLPLVCARSRFHPSQYAGEVVGTRCSTQASRTSSSVMA